MTPWACLLDKGSLEEWCHTQLTGQVVHTSRSWAVHNRRSRLVQYTPFNDMAFTLASILINATIPFMLGADARTWTDWAVTEAAFTRR